MIHVDSDIRAFCTGGSGFIGKFLIDKLIKRNFSITASVRIHSESKLSTIKTIPFSHEEQCFGFNKCKNDIDVVIHIAAITNADEYKNDLIRDVQKVNFESTIALAKQALERGVKRFVFLSSIKVNGEQTNTEEKFSEEHHCIPVDFYGYSKYKAEQGLLELAKNSNMEVVIIRPPLVYGPGVKANFASLIHLVKKALPIPFGAIDNKRSMVAIESLVDFIALCADRERSPQAANQVFLISDDEDVSTTQLLQKIAKAYGKKQWLIPVPVSWMKFAAKLLGKSEQAERLFGNLQVDCSKAKNLLGWKPVTTIDEQLEKMADAEK